jgi:TP901 family phage tail tape measure protein
MAVGDSNEIVDIQINAEARNVAKSAEEVRKLSAEISKLKAALDKNTNSADLGIKILREYEQQLEKLRNIKISEMIKGFTGEVKKNATAAKTASKEYKQLGNDLEALQKKYSQTQASALQFSKGFDQSTKAGRDGFRTWRQEMDKNIPFLMNPKNRSHLSANFKTLKKDLADTQKVGIANLGTFRSLENGMASTFTRGLTSSEKFAIKMGTLRHNVDSFFHTWRLHGKNMQWTGMQMMQGITLPIVGFGAIAVREFDSVNKQMRQLKKVTEFKEDYDALADAIKASSEEFAISRATMTGLYRDIAALGIEGETSIKKWVDEVSKVHLLGDMDIATATDFVRSVSAIFDDGKMEKTPEILAQLNAVADETSLQLADLADAFPEVAPTMKQMGFDAAGVASAIGAMYKQGIPATEGAHALKHGMTRLIDPTKDAKKVIDELGVSFFDVTGNASEGSKNLMLLARNLGDLTNEDRAKAVSEMFGGRQSARFNALVDDMTMGWDQIEAAMADGKITLEESKQFTSDWARSMVASGEITVEGAEDAGERYNRAMQKFKEDPSFQLELLKTKFKGLLVDLGSFIVPPMIKILGYFEKFFSKLMAAPNFVKYFVGAILLLASTMGPLIYVFAQAQNAIASFGITAARFIPKGFKLLTEGQVGELFESDPDREDIFNYKGKTGQFKNKYARRAAGESAERVTKADYEAAASSKVLEEATEDLTKDMAARAAATESAAIAEAKLNGPGLPGKPGHMANRQQVASGLAARKVIENGAMPGMFGGSTNNPAVLQYFANLADKGDEVADSLETVGTKADLMDNSVKKSSGGLSGLFNGLKNIGGTILKFGKFTIVTAAIAAAIGLVIFFIKEMAKHWDIIKERAKPAFDAIKMAIEAVKQAVMSLWTKFQGVIGQLGSSDGQGAIDFWTTIGDAINAVGGFIADLINIIALAIEKAWPLIEGIAYMFKNVIGFVTSLVNGEWKDAMMYLAAFVYEALRGVINWLEKAADLWLWYVGKVLGGLSWLARGFQEMLSWIGINTTAISGFFDTLGDRVEKTRNFDVVSFLDGKFRTLGGTLGESTAAAVPSAEEGPGDAAQALGEDMGETLGDALADEGKKKAKKGLSEDSWFKEFLSKVKSRIDEQVQEVKDAAIEALQKAHEAELALYDDKLKKLEEIEKAEEKLYREQEYLQKKREMLAKRAIDIQNYQRNRALAIYEGRIDDARMLDLEHEKNSIEFNSSISDLESERQKELLKEAREAEREKINLEKDAAQERQKIQEEAFKKQLDILTEYTPRTVEEFQKMVGSITSLLSGAGATWEENSSTASSRMFDAIRKANEDIRQDFAWSGQASITSWIAAFADSDVIDMLRKMGSDAGKAYGDGFEESMGGNFTPVTGGDLPQTDFGGGEMPEDAAMPEIEGPTIDFDKMWEDFKRGLERLGENVWNWFMTSPLSPWVIIRVSWETFWTTFMDPLINTFNTVSNIIGGVFSSIGDIISGVWENVVKPVFDSLWSVIQNQIIPIFRFFWDIVSWVFEGIGWSLGQLWESVIYPVFNSIRSWIMDTLVPKFVEFKDTAVEVWTTVSDWIRSKWDEYIYPVFDTIRSWIVDTLIPKFFEFKDKITDIWNKVSEKISSVWGTITGVIKEGLNKIIDVLNWLIRGWNTFKNFAPWAKDDPPVQEIPHLATGGVTNGLSIAGEGRYPEFVIPLDPQYRSNALSLTNQLVGRLGMANKPKVPTYSVPGGGAQTNIYVDTFIGEEEWFNQLAQKHDMKVSKRKALNTGSQGRVLKRYNENDRGSFR